MTDEFEPYLQLFCLDGQAEHAATFTDSLVAEDVEKVVHDHLKYCDGCALCTRNGVWAEIRRELNVAGYDYFYS